MALVEEETFSFAQHLQSSLSEKVYPTFQNISQPILWVFV
jgi:hypothetical protein